MQNYLKHYKKNAVIISARDMGLVRDIALKEWAKIQAVEHDRYQARASKPDQLAMVQQSYDVHREAFRRVDEALRAYTFDL